MYFSGSAAMAGLGIIHASLFCLMLKASAQYENCTSRDYEISRIQDGNCDTENNNAGCDFDGGDCCDCTLSDNESSIYNETRISSLNCVDPSDSCYSLIAVALQASCTNGTTTLIQDGSCDVKNNNEGCSYDGGDCCECTVSDNGSSIYNETLTSSLYCVDPSDPCYNQNAVALQESCTDGYIPWIQKGRCDIENNNEGCLYDGGDCCLCTCKDGIYNECGEYGWYDCSDPDAIALEPFICSEPPHAPINCSAELRREWIVENAAQARALADAVRCVGETFNVTWKGKIIVNETISIVNGTVLNITGIDYDAIVDGNGNTRMFTVVNGSLHLRDITLELGYAPYGGAIAASRSRITMDRVIFTENHATYGGGAMFVSNASNVSFCGETTCWKNIALHGGALYMTEGSSSSWTGNTNFSKNVAMSGNGGALYMKRKSIAVWTASSHFLSNSAHVSGGALYILYDSNATWTAESQFLSNRAKDSGGAVYIGDSSKASWTADSQFISNSAKGSGGALYIEDSHTTWTADSQFLFNSAEEQGGALYVFVSHTTWTADSQFISNSAEEQGGALYIYGSHTTWTADSQFISNSAEEQGGALYVLVSRSTWTADSQFVSNSVNESGGALYISVRSDATWTAHSQFVSNSANESGGALYISDDSEATWTTDSQFLYNSANGSGGALYVADSSNTTWTAASQFRFNSASLSGGALYVTDDSSAVWDGESQFKMKHDNASESSTNESCSCSTSWEAKATFFKNAATRDGGALYLGSYSTAFWKETSCFDSNSAYSAGGALSVVDESHTSWAEEAVFSENAATGDGGALYMGTYSSAVWTGTSHFLSNSAQADGGAVYAIADGSLSWENDVLFAENTAQSGGAIFVRDGVTISWSGKADFTSNAARLNGGAVGSRALDSELTTSLAGGHQVEIDEISSITFKNATTFFNNTCEENGGGMALVQSLAVSFNSKNIVFIRNTAGLSGGAIFVAATGIGPVLRNVTFIGNSAEIGGGVLVSGSGTAATVDINNKQVENPTRFYGCTFVGNLAFQTGGAVDSASGKDAFNGTVFKGNNASLGGALRFAGMASVDNCSFIDNVSQPDGGPAVFNVGTMSTDTGIYFNGNVFSCETQTFLDFKESQIDDLFEIVCSGCPGTCTGCSFGGVQSSPTCTAAMEHSTSEGGTTTIEGLYIQEGYWRATERGRNVYKCFNTKACVGGLTGTPAFCHTGYQGPYCSVCSKTYTPGLNYICQKCSDGTKGIAITVVIMVLIVAFGLAIFSYLVSAEVGGAGRGIVDRVTRWVPMQSIKIVIVAWQILTQFVSVANVTFPHVYQRLLDVVNFLNFDMSWVLSVGCFLEVNFHDRLLWTTITPIVLICFLGLTYAVAVRKHGGSSEIALRNAQNKHVSMALLITFLVYSSVSSVVFQMFVCDDLDDRNLYLRADYTITCDSPKHRALQIYASLMIFLFPVGIPILYACLLFRHRRILQNERDREESLEVMPTLDLWKPYKPQFFYYEVVECGRRILLAGVIVFIYPNTAAQIAVTLALAVVAGFVSESIAPYQSKWDAWLNRIGHVVVFASMYLALLLKIDVSHENTKSQKTFEVILVAVHGCMILAVIMEAVLMVLSLRAEKQREDPDPRRRQSSKFRVEIEASLDEEDDDGKDWYEL